MTAVVIREYVVADAGSGPYDVTTGPDGALWFTMVHSGEIGRLLPGGGPTRHQLDPGCGPTIIVTGPDGALWFTNGGNASIGRITTSGTVTKYTDVMNVPMDIALGSDGALCKISPGFTDLTWPSAKA